MKKVIVMLAESQVYSLIAPHTAESIALSLGITDSALYQEFDSSAFDESCYSYSNAFTLLGGVVGFDLAKAQQMAGSHAKTKAAANQAAVLNGYTLETLTAQASLPVLQRNPGAQDVLDALNTQLTELQARLDAINAAGDTAALNAALEG